MGFGWLCGALGVLFASFALSGCGRAEAAQVDRPAPWVAPKTSLGVEFLDATAFLLAHGFGDPRGGTLSRVTVADSGPPDVFGWVLPADKGRRRAVVTPDGVVHDVVEIKGKADVRLLEGQNWGRSSSYTDRFGYRYGTITCLLLRGEAKLAEEIYPWSQFKPNPRPFPVLATYYLTARFQRAASAHRTGNDKLALAELLSLQRERAAFEAEAMRILGPSEVKRWSMPINGGNGKLVYFRCLEPLDGLLKEVQERVAGVRKRPVNMAALKSLPASERIPRLMGALDQVHVQQKFTDGIPDLNEDPIVQALVKEGGAAVEPLLYAMEHDERLTQSFFRSGRFRAEPVFLTVKQAAYTAFRSIVQMEHFEPRGEPVDIVALRKFWAETESLSPAQRWMKVLGDDSATSIQWLEAAERIVEPANVHHVESSISEVQHVPSGPAAAMKGEGLRGLSEPSVVDLMIKRIPQIVERSDAHSTERVRGLRGALRMALLLNQWDSKAALPSLQTTTKLALARLPGLERYVFSGCGPTIARTIIARVRHGDRAAFEEYSQWIVTTQPGSSGFHIPQSFAPLATFSSDPAMIALGRRLFLGAESQWNLAAMSKDAARRYEAESLISSPLLANPAVLEAAIAVLGDKTPIGTAWVEQGGSRFELDGGGSGSLGATVGDTLAPPVGSKVAVRTCDMLALALSQLKGSPGFRPYWPVEERDLAIQKLVTFLTLHLGIPR